MVAPSNGGFVFLGCEVVAVAEKIIMVTLAWWAKIDGAK